VSCTFEVSLDTVGRFEQSPVPDGLKPACSAKRPEALPGYLRNVRLALYGRAQHIIMEMKK